MNFKNFFYFKNKLFDFRFKFIFFEIKIYFNSLFDFAISLLRIYNFRSILSLFNLKSSDNIVIFEPNDFHSEILPSWYFYLKNITPNQKIIFLASTKIHKINPFDLFFESEKKDYIFLKIDSIIVFLLYSLGFFKKFKKIIFNSNFYNFSRIDDSSNLLKIFTNKKILNNSIFLSHSILQSVAFSNLINNKNQLLTISKTIAEDAEIKSITPILNNSKYQPSFEKEQEFKKNKKFISCGNIKIKSKDSLSLEKSINLFSGLQNRLDIVGKASNFLTNNKNVNHYQNISFKKLKFLLLNNHFIFFLLNKNSSYQYKYNSSSGSLSLALNFNLIPIVEESFATSYLLNSDNSIIYKEGGLSSAITLAGNISYEQFIEMQKNLDRLKEDLIIETSDNIKQILS
jgi:hypothetical protein